MSNSEKRTQIEKMIEMLESQISTCSSEKLKLLLVDNLKKWQIELSKC